MVPDGWALGTGFRARVVPVQGVTLMAPAGLAFAGGDFGNVVFLADVTAKALVRLNPSTGTATAFVSQTQWARTPVNLAAVLWDAGRAFDGKVYVSDRGTTANQDSVIFRVGADGVNSILTAAPGVGLDDAYAIAFSPGGSYSPGLYVGGDTDVDDANRAGWGRIDANGGTLQFATWQGANGIDVDRLNRFGGGLFVSAPMGDGWDGLGGVHKINPDGSKGTTVVTGLPTVAALTFAPNGPFGGDAFVVVKATGKILRIAPGGVTAEVATGLDLTGPVSNNLAFSPDGHVLLVSETGKARVVCIDM